MSINPSISYPIPKRPRRYLNRTDSRFDSDANRPQIIDQTVDLLIRGGKQLKSKNLTIKENLNFQSIL